MDTALTAPATRSLRLPELLPALGCPTTGSSTTLQLLEALCQGGGWVVGIVRVAELVGGRGRGGTAPSFRSRTPRTCDRRSCGYLCRPVNSWLQLPAGWRSSRRCCSPRAQAAESVHRRSWACARPPGP